MHAAELRPHAGQGLEAAGTGVEVATSPDDVIYMVVQIRPR
jgi:hypothetical protein